jgi:hypothetical protein
MPLPHTCSEHASTCSYNQELQHLFIDKYLQGTTPIPTFKEVVRHYLTHEHNGPIIYQVVGSSPPWSPMILVVWEHFQLCPMFSSTSPMIPWSWMPITATNPCSACPYGIPNYQLLLGLSYALDSPSSKFQIVPSWINDLHKLLRAAEFSSACKLPISVLPNSTTAPVLVSLSPWRVFLPGLNILLPSPCSSTICAVDFLWRTYSCTNLRCRFIPLVAWLPAPLDIVLDSLPKYAPRAHLTLLQLS